MVAGRALVREKRFYYRTRLLGRLPAALPEKKRTINRNMRAWQRFGAASSCIFPSVLQTLDSISSRLHDNIHCDRKSTLMFGYLLADGSISIKLGTG